MDASQIGKRAWSYAGVLRDAGLSCFEYVEQLTLLLFLKMADQLTEEPYNRAAIVPLELGWKALLPLDGTALEDQYRTSLEKLGVKPGMLGVIFKGARCEIHNPARLKQLIVTLLDQEDLVEGMELSPKVGRMCAMNAYLHGIGGEKVVVHTGHDSLAAPWSREYSVVLANPPFGKKQSLLFVNEEGDTEKEDQVIVREDFWTSTSNKQLNFVQHIYSLLKIDGRAAVVLPDNVLFEGGAGDRVRRNLLHKCRVHNPL